MFRPLYAFTFLLTFAAASALAAKPAGPGEPGGGGNAKTSSRADLEAVVRQLPTYISDLSDRALVGHPVKVTSRPMPLRLSRMSEAMLGSTFFTIPQSTVEYIRTLKFNIIDAPCIHEGQEKDASTIRQKNAPVCLSASRLARFPKSALNQVLVPLLFHEIAHQFNYEEDDAMAFQELTELYVTYRPIYLSALRGWFTCGYASETITEAQKKQILDGALKAWGKVIPKFEKISGTAKIPMMMTCASWAASTAENLEKNYEGDRGAVLSLTSIDPSERKILIDQYTGSAPLQLPAIIRSLTEPGRASYCSGCAANKVDRTTVIMIASKAAVEIIDDEVARLQNEIGKKQ